MKRIFTVCILILTTVSFLQELEARRGGGGRPGPTGPGGPGGVGGVGGAGNFRGARGAGRPIQRTPALSRTAVVPVGGCPTIYYDDDDDNSYPNNYYPNNQ